MRNRNKGRYSEMSEGLHTQSQEEIKSHKPISLPKIKKKKYVFMDDVSVSEDYIKISEEKKIPTNPSTGTKRLSIPINMTERFNHDNEIKCAI